MTEYQKVKCAVCEKELWFDVKTEEPKTTILVLCSPECLNKFVDQIIAQKEITEYVRK